MTRSIFNKAVDEFPDRAKTIQTVSATCPHCSRIIRIIAPPSLVSEKELAEYYEGLAERYYDELVAAKHCIKALASRIP